METNLNEFQNQEADIVKYFMTLKSQYDRQRESLEENWDEALRAYFNSKDLKKNYTGFADVRVPEIDKKVTAVVSRIESIIFNITRLGRIEPMEMSELDPDIIELQNQYIFNYQLNEIGFRDEYHQYNLLQAIQGTAIAKITQELDVRDSGDGYVSVIRDNTFFRTLDLKSFYSDITKMDIRDSAANIHVTEIELDKLYADEKRESTGIGIDEEGNETEETIIEGTYFNLDMLGSAGLSEERDDYLQILGITDARMAELNKYHNETKKTGIVRIDECYGMYDLNGDGIAEECLITIANESVVIRAQATPFKHNRYIRPFIVGRYKVKPNFLYGESNTIKTLPLLRELNASRSMVTDSKNFSIFPMTYINTTNAINWDGVWKPMGVIKGVGPNPVSHIVNPANIGISLTDSNLIQRDIDEVWSISPIQQGVSDRRYLPETARQTNALIAQNEFPLDNIVIRKVDNELKPFIEMLFERNLIFKSPMEMIKVLNPEDVKNLDIEQLTSLPAMLSSAKVKVIGNMKLSQEENNKAGYERVLALAQEIPNLARRVDYKALTDKLLAAYGILDDSKEIFLNETTVQEQLAKEQEQKAIMQQLVTKMQEQAQQAQQLAEENANMRKMIEKQQAGEDSADIQKYVIKKKVDLEADTAKMQMETDEKTKQRVAEAEIEIRSGKKVN